MPANTEAVMVFQRCQTQWTYAGDPPAHTGLRMEAVTACLDALGVPQERRSDLLGRIQIIEMKALEVLGRIRMSDLARIRRQQPQSARSR
ncbi:DUF1799 domain-containing protein [Thalassobaculum litoreum]|nr:DUF1799 domain-containing protein [Thalassobaculum litoreum]